MNNGNKPAMPLGDSRINYTEVNELCAGLTKREHFAAMAMQGILASSLEVPEDINNNEQFCEWIAESAVMYSDALLIALEANNE